MGRYSWIPAGINYKRDGGTGIFIKYGRYPNKVIVRERGPGYVWLQCPDRELIVTSNLHYAHGFYPMASNFDEYVHLGIFNDHLFADAAPEFFMVNYTSEIGKEHSSHRTRTIRKTDGVKIVSDSGGYQLFQQRLEYLDPVEIVRWYNDNADIGIVLDIPSGLTLTEDYRRLGQIQRNNTELMVQNKADSLELMNIVHGPTSEIRNVFRGLVERPDITRLAIGGAYMGTVLNSIDYLYNEMHASDLEYTQYHVLGVSNPLQVILLMRMAAKGFAPLITSDSSTFLQHGIAKSYFTFTQVHETFGFVGCGDNNGYQPSVAACLPCSCPVCSALKYADALYSVNSNSITQVFLYHNIFAMRQYFDAMSDLCATLETRDLKDLLKKQLTSGRSGYEEAIRGIDYIDVIQQEGVAAARKRYKFYLTNLMIRSSVSGKGTGQLFNVDGNLDIEGEDENVRHEIDSARFDTSQRDEFLKIVNRYEDAQASNEALKHGKKTNAAIKRLGANSASAKQTPGKKKKDVSKQAKREKEEKRKKLEAERLEKRKGKNRKKAHGTDNAADDPVNATSGDR